MNVAEARDLKQQIRSVASSEMYPRLAVGIGVTGRPGVSRIAILLYSREDYHLLETPRMRALLRSVERHVDVEVLEEPVRASGAGSAPEEDATLTIGASVGHFTGGDGALGFFAAQRSTGRRGFVSCNHVIALADRGVDGDGVISPSGSNGGRSPRNRVGTLDGRYPRLAGADRAVADCAFAFLDNDVPYDPVRVEGGALVAEPTIAVEQLEVTKTGWLTGTRSGVVMKIEVDDIPVRYGGVKVFFDGVIQIGSTSFAPFAAQGDSGALVYATRTFQPVALLFATSYAGGPFHAGWAWAHPIGAVTRALDVDMIVTRAG